jgi:RNA polymerase sigma factor (sigma-70 family)
LTDRELFFLPGSVFALRKKGKSGTERGPGTKTAGKGLTEDFARVLNAARNGSQDAWTRLYRAYAPGIRGYLRSRGAAEPDDLTGEVFLHVVRALPTFTGEERDFRAWIFTIAHNRFLDERRAAARRRADPSPVEAIHSRALIGDVESDALRQLETDRILRLIGSLTRTQQSVLLLRLLGDLKVDEVARVLGKRPGAVKAAQRRGLASLRKKIRDEP